MSQPNQQLRHKLFELVDKINVWHRDGERAPHKPLLLLKAIAIYCEHPDAIINFRDLETPLALLIRTYGPTRESVHPEYPFWRLQNDGLWEVTTDRLLIKRCGHDDPRLSELRSANARGVLPQWIVKLIREDSSLVNDVVTRVLNAHFPHELHDRLLRDTGLSKHIAGVSKPLLDYGEYWESALAAYGYRCAISGLGVRSGGNVYGVSPTLIRWPQAGGQVVLNNTLVLSDFYRELFVFGLMTITPDHRVIMVDGMDMTPETKVFVGGHQGRKIRVPASPSACPLPQNLCWHNRQVFKGRLVT